LTGVTQIDSRARVIGTAAAAKALWATLALSAPATISPIPEALATPSRSSLAPRITSRARFLTESLPSSSGTVASWPESLVGDGDNDQGDRATTDQERLVGEIRRWALMNANWDGEGAAPPAVTSLEESVAFVRLISNSMELPEPMLLSSGHAGLFWKTEDLYADLEFLGDGRIAYFIEHEGEGRHKGVVKFDSEKMPAVFPALLRG
jgi:hypothetical protein